MIIDTVEASMKNKKTFICGQVKTITDDGRLLGIVGSTAAIDRYGEIVDQNTWQLDNYKKNAVILWAHNLTFGEDRPPIGKALDVRVQDGALHFDIQFDLSDEFAADIFRKYKEGFLNAFSVGFIPHRIERVDDQNQPQLRAVLKDNELLELSCVPVPANAEALQSLRSKSFKTKTWDKMLEEVDLEVDEDKADMIDKTATAVIEKIAPTLTKTITDVVTEAMKRSPKEDKSGAADTAPEKPTQGTEARLLSLIRETTKTFQSELAKINAQAKK